MLVFTTLTAVLPICNYMHVDLASVYGSHTYLDCMLPGVQVITARAVEYSYLAIGLDNYKNCDSRPALTDLAFFAGIVL